MRWIGAFNVAYGATGLAAAAYLGRSDAVLLCLWVMASGLLMRTDRVRGWMRRLLPRVRTGGRR